jgi:hypothetical protein
MVEYEGLISQREAARRLGHCVQDYGPMVPGASSHGDAGNE